MVVQGSVPGRADEAFGLDEGNVLVRLGVAVLLGQAEVDHVDDARFLAQTDQEVFWLHVPVDQVLGVQGLDAGHQLVCDQQDCFERESLAAELEELLEVGTQQLHHHGVVAAFAAVPEDDGNPLAALQGLEDFGLVLQLARLFTGLFELYRDFLVVLDVDPVENVPEGTGADFTPQPVSPSYSNIYHIRGRKSENG